jgi:hypothetical protein
MNRRKRPCVSGHGGWGLVGVSDGDLLLSGPRWGRVRPDARMRRTQIRGGYGEAGRRHHDRPPPFSSSMRLPISSAMATASGSPPPVLSLIVEIVLRCTSTVPYLRTYSMFYTAVLAFRATTTTCSALHPGTQRERAQSSERAKWNLQTKQKNSNYNYMAVCFRRKVFSADSVCNY